jgi:aspartyl-tRNA(Asn)/glutamyl-tRNA(Gln) amidotransferase subunit A
MIEEFLEAEKPQDYYIKLIGDLKFLNGKLNAFNQINEKINSGIPFSVKDNICVKNVGTTASSKILKGYIPPFDATVIERMPKEFSFIGKTNMDEFGFGSWGINTENIARNPFDERHVAGGSSSGAAIATSVLKYHVAIAESTGGSIATPASFCGVVGFTPTYGSISRYGLIDYSNSLDKIGIMARSSSDIKRVLKEVRGPDKKDTTAVSAKTTNQKYKKLILIDQLIDSLDDEVKSKFMSFVDRLSAMGYAIENRSIKHLTSSIPTYYIIAMAEASTNLAKYNGYKYGFKNEEFGKNYNEFFSDSRANFGAEAKRRVVLGTFVRSASIRNRYYDKAMRIRRLIINEMDQILKDGFIISPVMPIQTPKIDEVKTLTPVQTYKMDILTIPPNLCGYPHISFPYAYHKDLPLGAQLISNHFNDDAVIDFVSEWEKGFEYKFRYNLGSI